MTKLEIKKVRSKTKRYAKSLGLNSNDAEDISQEVLLRCIEKGWKQPVQFAVIDIIRRKFGRRGEKKNQEVEILNNLHELTTKSGRERLELDSALVGLDKMDRAMIILRCVWGFGLEEIAYCFDMSATGVMQRMERCYEL